jgi:hypothetical protein
MKRVSLPTLGRCKFAWGAFGLSILYVCLYHAYVMHVLPDPIIEPDSMSYLGGVLRKLSGGDFTIPRTRGMGYPVLLWVGLQVFRHFHGMLWLQHSLWMITTTLTVAIFLKYRPAQVGWAAGLFLLVGCSPRGTFLSHSILSDAVYTFWQMVSLAGFLGVITRHPSVNGWVGGTSLAMAMNTRPVGKTLLVAAAVLLGSKGMSSQKKKVASGVLLGFALTMIPFLAYNKWHRGFWGVEVFGNFYAAANAIRHLEPEEIKNADVRQVLTPFYRTRAIQNHFDDLNWMWYAMDGPIRALRDHPTLGPEFDSVLQELFLNMVFRHPFVYSRNLILTGIQFVWSGSQPQRVVPNKQLSLQRGLMIFYQSTQDMPAMRTWLSFRPETASAYFSRIRDVALAPFEPGPMVFYPVWGLYRIYGLMSWLGVLSLAWLCYRSSHLPVVQGSVCLILGQVLMVAIGGTYVYRYAIPLEPLYALLLFLVLSDGVQSGTSINKSTPRC